MIIVIDANVVIANPRLLGPEWAAVRDAVAAGRVSVVMPEFAVWEAIAVTERQRGATAARIRAQRRHASKAVKELLEQAAALAEKEGANQDATIRATLAESGVTIEAAPEPAHSSLVRRAITRTRPFDDKGSGYRDALLWHLFLNVVDQFWEEHELVFVSSDRAAFGPAGNDIGHRLHPELEAELAGAGVYVDSEGEPMDVKWARRLIDVEIPGEFDPAPVQLDLLVSRDEIASHLLSTVLSDEPIEVDPASSPFGLAVVGAIITDLTEPVVTQAEGRSYYNSERVAIDFAVEMTASYLGFNVENSDELFSAVESLDDSGEVRFEGRAEFIPSTRQFGETTWRLMKNSEWTTSAQAVG